MKSGYVDIGGNFKPIPTTDWVLDGEIQKRFMRHPFKVKEIHLGKRQKMVEALTLNNSQTFEKLVWEDNIIFDLDISNTGLHTIHIDAKRMKHLVCINLPYLEKMVLPPKIEAIHTDVRTYENFIKHKDIMHPVGKLKYPDINVIY